MEIRLANKETGPISTRINDTDILKNIILNFWHKKEYFFPAPQPVSLERRDLTNLINNEYYVCPKSDGMRFLMLCYDDKTYMIDRAFKFYQVNQKFNNKLLYIGGTENNVGGIFDGELVKNKKDEWQYVIHDCISIMGQEILYDNFPKRYEKIEQFVKSWKEGDFVIKKKDFFDLSNIKLLNNQINENLLDHNTDGLIFTPKNKKIGSGTQYDLYKWKPRKLHTFDFKIIIDENNKNIPGKIAAYVNNAGKHELYASCPAVILLKQFF